MKDHTTEPDRQVRVRSLRCHKITVFESTYDIIQNPVNKEYREGKATKTSIWTEKFIRNIIVEQERSRFLLNIIWILSESLFIVELLQSILQECALFPKDGWSGWDENTETFSVKYDKTYTELKYG